MTITDPSDNKLLPANNETPTDSDSQKTPCNIMFDRNFRHVTEIADAANVTENEQTSQVASSAPSRPQYSATERCAVIKRIFSGAGFSEITNVRNRQDTRRHLMFRVRMSHFDIESVLQRTEMREVVKATPLPCRRVSKFIASSVVIKCVHRQDADSSERRDIRQEALVQKNLHQHPNIAKLITTFTVHQRHFLVTEYCPGGDLFNAMSRFSGGIPESVAIGIILQVLDAVQFMHSNGYAHRDIKLENIVIEDLDTLLVDEIPAVKLIDFGSACHWNINRPSSCIRYDPKYTLGYAPPEIFVNHWYCPKAVDVFCVGGVLYRMLSTTDPFICSSVPEYIKSLLQMDLSMKHKSFKSVSLRTRRFIQLCLSIHPKERPTAQTALSVLRGPSPKNS